jgi:hypothetical protein
MRQPQSQLDLPGRSDARAISDQFDRDRIHPLCTRASLCLSRRHGRQQTQTQRQTPRQPH